MKKIIYLTIIMILTITASGFSDVPNVISYQGKLTDVNGQNIDGESKLTFNIYDNKEDGNCVWGPSEKTINVNDGHYSVQLSTDASNRKLSDTFANVPNAYIQITLNKSATETIDIMPRQTILSVPYAFSANTVSDNSISSLKIINGSVTNEKIADRAVTEDKLADGAVTGQKIKSTTHKSVIVDWQGTSMQDWSYSGEILSGLIIEGPNPKIVTWKYSASILSGWPLISFGSPATATKGIALKSGKVTSVVLYPGTYSVYLYSGCYRDNQSSNYECIAGGDAAWGKLTDFQLTITELF